MVDGIGSNQNILKLKGQNKTIDTNANVLKNLQLTEKSKQLIDLADGKNGGVKDGKLDEKEAEWLGNHLRGIAGNGKISKRELGKNKIGMDALNALADQQNAVGQGKEYVENNGKITTHIYQSTDTKNSYRYDSTADDSGNVINTFDDGTKETIYKDGSRDVINKDGTITKFDSKGNKTTIIKDGLTTTFSADGLKSTTVDKTGKVVSSFELKDNKEVKIDYEYKDGQTISRETVDGKAGSVTVSYSKDGHTVDTKYNSEDDFKNQKPSEKIIDRKNSTLTKTTKFTYDDNGNVKLETLDSAGQKEVIYKNSKGEKIKSNMFNAPESHTVAKGESIQKIVINALKAQGVENPSKEQIKSARAELLEANKDKVKNYNGKNPKLKGNKFFYVNEKINIPNFAKTDKNSEQVSDTSVKPSPEVSKLKDQLQTRLGDSAKISYTKDGFIVTDKNGKELPKATKMANDKLKAFQQSQNKTSFDDIPSDDEDINTMLKNDKDGNGLDKTEYREFMLNMLKENGIDVTADNQTEIDNLIEQSFNDMDTIKKDGHISKEELRQNAKKVLQNLDNIDAQNHISKTD